MELLVTETKGLHGLKRDLYMFLEKKFTGVYQLHRNPVHGAKAQSCTERKRFREHLRVTACLVSLFLPAYLLPAKHKFTWGMGGHLLLQVHLEVGNEAASPGRGVKTWFGKDTEASGFPLMSLQSMLSIACSLDA